MAIRIERPDDFEAIREINTSAFGQSDEANLVDALREGGFARLSLVAEEGDRIVGHVLFSNLPILTSTGYVPALALAPMAVFPEFQRRGIGSALILEGLNQCRVRGHRIVVVLGHKDYYPRFGFLANLAESLTCPYSGPHLMAMELEQGALTGVVGELQYPPPFQSV